MAKTFADVSEKEITRTIAEMFNETMQEYTDSDVIIVGAGPAGLTAGRDLAESWLKNTYCGTEQLPWRRILGRRLYDEPSHREGTSTKELWDELGVPYRKVKEGNCPRRGALMRVASFYKREHAMLVCAFCS